MTQRAKPPIYFVCRGYNDSAVANVAAVAVVNKAVVAVINVVESGNVAPVVDGVSPSVFRCTSTPMETGPIDACVET